MAKLKEKKVQIEAPSLNLRIELQGNIYEIEFPKTGEYLDIEANKQMLSNNQYNGIASSNAYAKMLIDAVATFDILIPNLYEDLRVKSLLDLTLKNQKEVLKIYINKYLPWQNAWLAYLNDFSEVSIPEVEESEEGK